MLESQYELDIELFKREWEEYGVGFVRWLKYNEYCPCCKEKATDYGMYIICIKCGGRYEKPIPFIKQINKPQQLMLL